ncbi:MAG: DUF4194 domain-containing protein [Proteobacteria bacterium]|jgi:hypothetical protein|nr:DUF4194 domain-containing protein [Pseudomonadota bacterium]MDA1300491.1 DUF4194 domain-containing protein [Pseudomonadota bacterium]
MSDSFDAGIEDGATPAVSQTSSEVKTGVQELLRNGLIENEHKPAVYRTATVHKDDINVILEPLDLELRVDEVRGLAFLGVRPGTNVGEDQEQDEWSHPLVRRQRLTLEQSLLVVLLRQLYLIHEQEKGTSADFATISLEEVTSQLDLYFATSGSDTRDQQRVRNLISQISVHGIVYEVDEHDSIRIRPLITHFADPESLNALLAQYQRIADDQTQAPDSDG